MPREPGYSRVEANRERRPGGGGKPPKVKPKPSPKLPTLPGMIDPKTGKVAGVTSALPKPKNQSQIRETLRRQRLLKSNGYSIVVDGVWGPRSQRAWQDYLRRNRAGQTAPFKREGVTGRTHLDVDNATHESRPKGVPQGVVTPAELAAQRRADAERARREAERQRQQIRAEVLARAETLRKSPEAARALTLRQLSDVLLERETKMGVETKQGARAAQTWLRAHGHNVNVTGVYDRQTHDALQAAFRRAERNETKKRVKAARDLMLRVGVEPGDKPVWFPLAGGVPKPADLDRMLQEGGFTASVVLRSLLQHVSEAAVFNQVREAELRRLAAQLQPMLGGPGQGKLALRPNLLQIYAAILGATDLAPMPDLSGLSPEEQQRAMEMRAGSDEIQGENAKRVLGLRAEVHALTRADSPEEFKRQLVAQVALAEKKFTDVQKRLAADAIPWWGKVVEKVMAPGEFMRTAVLYDVMRAEQLVIGRDGERALTWEDAQVALGRDPETIPDYDGLMGRANRALTFGLELTFDPLNFVHPLRTASTFLKAGTKGSTLGSYRVGRASGFLVRGDGIWSKALVYERGTWSKTALAEKLIRADDPLNMVDSAFGRRARAEVEKLTQLRETAIAKAQARVTTQIRNGFKKPAASTAAWKGIKPKNAAELDEARSAVKAWLHDSPELTPLVQALRDDAASLYVDAERTTYSNVGAALLANLAEKARIAAVHQLATDAADSLATSLIERGLGEAERLALLNEEYAKIIRDAGAYIMGGQGDKVMASEIFGRTISRMDDIEHVLLPAIQDMLEESAGVMGLFDESGLWLSRNGEQANAVRALGADSFADDATVEIANPAYGIGHTHAEFIDLLESEVRRRTPRIYGYAARGLKAGTLPDNFNVDEAVEGVRQDVMGAWEKRSDGLYYDTRRTVEASALYTRHLADAYHAMLDRAATMPRSEREMVQALAAPPGFVTNGPVDDGLWRVSWTMGSRYGYRPSIDHPTRRMMFPEAPAGAGRQEARDHTLREYDRGKVLNEAVARTKVHLAAASDEAFPRELMRERLYYVALAKAQSIPFKVLYNALYGAMAVWKFAALPLKFGWVVRNTIDNAMKAIIAGVRDPRLFFLGAAHPGSGIRSVFDLGLWPLRQTCKFLDQLFGTNALEAFDGIVNSIWQLPADTLGRIFKAHGLPDMPEAMLDEAKFQLDDGWKTSVGSVVKVGTQDFERAGMPVPKKLQRAESPTSAQRLGKKIAASPNLLWELMATRPENYFKRMIYRSEYEKGLKAALAEGASDTEAALLAHERAWDSVVDTLFDYSKISVVEDNFKVFFPFIQFWRKNTTFWAKSFGTKPWLSNAVLQFDSERQEAHADLPPWMRRYIHADEIVDAAGVVPGLDTVVDAMLPDDAMFDPMSFASFAPLYRAYRDQFYGDNQNLPTDKPGMAILGPMFDAMNDFGLSMNPLVRKPLEASGVASERAWQSMFPQTDLAVAFTREFISESAALKVASWESAFERLPLGVSSDAIAENFEFYVQQEIAGQVARGEEPNRAAAEATIRAWFITQTAWGYFGGVYWRRATPEDIFLSKISVGMIDYDALTDEEKGAAKLWSMRGMDRLTYDRYLQMLPLIEAYYRLDSPAEKAELVEEHPELRRHVSAAYRGKPFSGKWLRDSQRYMDTARFFNALRIVESLDPAQDVREDALSIFASRELRDYWAANDTPDKIRQRQVRGEVHRYYRDLSESYFSIPETDYEARDGFISEHPELVRFWNRNNDPADDYEAILDGANAALREQYFDIVATQGWDAAASLLKRHPFMFEDTKAASKVDDETGEWIGGGSGKWSAERRAAFLNAKPHLNWFFDSYMKQVGEQAAWSWLETSETDAAKIVRDYLKRFGKQSARALAYMKAKHWLDIYFGMSEEERAKWLASDAEGAKVVKAYFEKYASDRGMTQHARDYLDRKGDLDYYFALPKEQRSAWLNGSDPRAARVLEYFKKYGKTHQYERLLKQYPALATGTPEQQRRIEFWKKFFSLPPDERPAFATREAEAHGIFIYGEFGEAERHDQEMEWMRRAVGMGLSDRQKAFLYVRPLLAFYRTLSEKEKPLFLRANPELQEYFDQYSTKSMTGDKKLDAEVEAYFNLPADSFARSEFLRKHPAVQDWFDKRSSPAERAMRNLLEQYFGLRNAILRDEFLLDHPEIVAYFERRREEKSNEADVYDAFDLADPRLREFFEQASQLEEAAALMRDQLRRQAYDSVGGIETRRERRPQPV